MTSQSPPSEPPAPAPDSGAARDVTFRLLGPLDASLDGRPLPLGGAKQRALLAVLLLNANRVVSVDHLLVELWGDDPPRSAQKMVQVLVSRLRRTLKDDQRSDPLLLTQSPGYVLKLGPGRLDLETFESLVASGKDMIEDDPAAASARLASALSMWRGAPLSDVSDEPFAAVAIARLEELRLGAVEARIEADLASGKSGEVVAELQELVNRHPLRERLHGQLMLALYRSGRQAEALAVYHCLRETLVEELGIEPSPELRRLEGAILRQEAGLELRRDARLPDPPILETGIPEGPVPEALAPAAVAARALDEPPSEQLGPSAMGRHRRSNLVVAVILVMALIVGGFLWLRRGGGPSGVAVRPNSVALFDPRASRVVSDAVAGSSPGPLAVESGSLWVGNQGDHTLTRIDLRNLRALRTFGLSYPPAALAAGDGYVWIVDGFTGTVSRLIAAYDQLSAPNFPGPVVEGLVAVAASGGDLWMGLSNRQLLEVDPSSLQVRATVRGVGHVQAIAVSGNDIWTIQFDDSDLRRVSRRAGAVADSLPLPPHPIAIAADSKSIWVATSQDDRLWQIDAASARVVRSIPLGVSPTALADGAGGVWVVAGQAGILEGVDPATGDLVRTVHVGRPVGGIVVTAAGVWLSAD